MALPNSGAISTTQIMLELEISTGQKSWSELWGLAPTSSPQYQIYLNGGPYILPNDWWSFDKSLYPKLWEFSVSFSYKENGCAFLPNYPNNFFTSASVVNLSEGTRLFNESTMISPVNGGNLWWKSKLENTVFQVDNNGYITDFHACFIPPPTGPGDNG